MLNSLTSNPFILGFILLFIGVGATLYLVYFFDRIFIKKRLSTLDFIIIAFNFGLALYSAVNANIAFDQDLKQGLFSAWGRQTTILMVIIAQYLIRGRRVKIMHIFYVFIAISWMAITINFYITQTVDPRTLVDTDLVGYNPAKGGYVFRFSSEAAMIGVVYYFTCFIMRIRWYYFAAFAIFMSYMLFVDKGRIDIVALFLVMAFSMIRNLNVINFLRVFIILTIITVVGVVIMNYYFPDALMVLRNMLLNFALAIVGLDTGEGSVDARFFQFNLVFDYFAKYPEHMVFGTGILNREEMMWRFGELYLKDIGIVGIFFAFGFVGVIALYSLFIYALRLTLNIKFYKKSLVYKLTESIILMMFVSSFFNGGFVWAPGSFLTQLLFLQILSMQDKELQLKQYRET